MKDTERHNYIGDHIRKLREEKGWTQQVLGKLSVPMKRMPNFRLSTALLKWPNCSMYRLTHWFMGIVQI